MKQKWLIIALCSFLLGAVGTAGIFLLIDPKDNSRETSAELLKKMERIVEAYEYIHSLYVEEVSEEELIEGAIQGMVSRLNDPYSVYMDEATAERFDESLDSSFDGIGAQITIQDGKLLIIAPIKNSPAEKAGLKPLDQIIKIDGESVDGLDVYQASKKIRGKKGTVVKLEILRSGISQPIMMEIERDEIPLLTVFSEVIESQGKKIGYIEITSFARETGKDFAKELEELEKENIDGLIIDLRGNPGGLLSSVEEIMHELVTDEKPYIFIEDRNGKKQGYHSKRKEKKPYPIHVLIDEGSASASEILAASLHEITGYPLIGKNTFGKGTVQQAIPLEDGGNIKLTMYKWLTPNETWIHGKGIPPTIEVEQPEYFYGTPLQVENTLELDMNDELVAIAQKRLKGLGFSPGRTDGYFDEQTEKAVRAFQAIEKLPVTGKIDPITAQKMEEQIRERMEDEKNDLQLQVALKTILQQTTLSETRR